MLNIRGVINSKVHEPICGLHGIVIGLLRVYNFQMKLRLPITHPNACGAKPKVCTCVIDISYYNFDVYWTSHVVIYRCLTKLRAEDNWQISISIEVNSRYLGRYIEMPIHKRLIWDYVNNDCMQWYVVGMSNWY